MKILGLESIGRSLLRRGLLLIPLGIALTWFMLSPQARAVDLPPGGGFWTWIAAGRLNTARYNHTATLLPNGKVLAVGGYDRGTLRASAELYDPVSSSWTATGSLNTARDPHTATLLRNGRVLVAGGRDSPFGFVSASVELYSPASGKWTTTGFLHGARQLHTATPLQNGIVLVAGGLDHNNLAEPRAELGRPPF